MKKKNGKRKRRPHPRHYNVFSFFSRWSAFWPYFFLFPFCESLKHSLMRRLNKKNTKKNIKKWCSAYAQGYGQVCLAHDKIETLGDDLYQEGTYTSTKMARPNPKASMVVALVANSDTSSPGRNRAIVITAAKAKKRTRGEKCKQHAVNTERTGIKVP